MLGKEVCEFEITQAELDLICRLTEYTKEFEIDELWCQTLIKTEDLLCLINTLRSAVCEIYSDNALTFLNINFEQFYWLSSVVSYACREADFELAFESEYDEIHDLSAKLSPLFKAGNKYCIRINI